MADLFVDYSGGRKVGKATTSSSWTSEAQIRAYNDRIGFCEDTCCQLLRYNHFLGPAFAGTTAER
ncbi:hypothetical protein XH97_15370 [Bradyrhizobium sp. CCBAU 53380]|nr:hypothetical protein [Bradyrhizobium sp. CCBAU 53380]